MVVRLPPRALLIAGLFIPVLLASPHGNSSLLLDGYFAKAVRGEIAAAQVFESIRETIQTEIKKTTQNAVFDLSES